MEIEQEIEKPRKEMNKFLYCFRKFYNFQNGIIKRGKIFRDDKIYELRYPNVAFVTIYDKLIIGWNFRYEEQNFLDFCRDEYEAMIDRRKNFKDYL